MKDVIYPAVFTKDEEDESWYNVSFFDIMAGVTCGKGMVDAILMAEDLLALMEEEAEQQCYEPSPIEKVRERFPNADYALYIRPCYHKRDYIEKMIEKIGVDGVEEFIERKKEEVPSLKGK